jgi:uncharacterized membrane protein
MLRALGLVLLAAWPLLVFFGVRAGATRLVAGAAVVALLGRGLGLLRRADAATRRRLLTLLAATAIPAVGAAVSEDPRLLMLLPVAVSLALLAGFGRTLLGPGPSMAETFARLQVEDLSPAEQRYCRGVTAVWCGFFAANALVAGVLAAAGALAAWTLWTGLLAYLAMGLLFAGELTLRTWKFRRYHGLPTDPLFRRLFPPREDGASGAPPAD